MSTMALRTGEAVAMDGAFFVRERGRGGEWMGGDEAERDGFGLDLSANPGFIIFSGPTRLIWWNASLVATLGTSDACVRRGHW